MPPEQGTSAESTNEGANTDSPSGTDSSQIPANQEATLKESQAQAKTFTQEEVNELLGRTRQEGRERAIAGLLKDTGMKDVDSLKEVINQAEQKRLDQLSEFEKLSEEVEKLRPFEQKAKDQDGLIEQYEKAVETHLEALMKTMDVPDHVKPLLSNMAILDQLAYLSEHGEAFMKEISSVPPSTNVSDKGSGKNGAKERQRRIRQKYGIQ